MLVRKCDRCGKVYESYADDEVDPRLSERTFNSLSVLSVDSQNKHYSGSVLDLCETCRDSLAEWFLSK